MNILIQDNLCLYIIFDSSFLSLQSHKKSLHLKAQERQADLESKQQQLAIEEQVSLKAERTFALWSCYKLLSMAISQSVICLWDDLHMSTPKWNMQKFVNLQWVCENKHSLLRMFVIMISCLGDRSTSAGTVGLQFWKSMHSVKTSEAWTFWLKLSICIEEPNYLLYIPLIDSCILYLGNHDCWFLLDASGSLLLTQSRWQCAISKTSIPELDWLVGLQTPISCDMALILMFCGSPSLSFLTSNALRPLVLWTKACTTFDWVHRKHTVISETFVVSIVMCTRLIAAWCVGVSASEGPNLQSGIQSWGCKSHGVWQVRR